MSFTQSAFQTEEPVILPVGEEVCDHFFCRDV